MLATAPGPRACFSTSLSEALPTKGPRRPSSVLPRRVGRVPRPRSGPAVRPRFSGPCPAGPCRGCGPSLVAAGAPPRLGRGLGEQRTARRRLLTLRSRARGRLCMQTLSVRRALAVTANCPRRRGRGEGRDGGGASGAARGPPRGASLSASFRALLAPGSRASFGGRLQSGSPFFTAHLSLPVGHGTVGHVSDYPTQSQSHIFNSRGYTDMFPEASEFRGLATSAVGQPVKALRNPPGPGGLPSGPYSSRAVGPGQVP